MALPFDAAIAAFEPPLPLAVALSGGADSTALLVASARRWPGNVSAIHINHGLQPAAADFERHCAALCARLGVPLQVSRVQARHASGQSPEDAARIARYEAIDAAARDGAAPLPPRCVALAHHADDQVESVLLAFSRGAGLAGLAGMRAHWERDGISYCRPLLQVAAVDIRAWLKSEGIAWIEDPTNLDEQFTRNRIRARLLPALGEAFPSYRDTFARSARHAAQAQALLEEVAAQDLALCGVPPSIQALRAMSRARQANLLRHWLKSAHGQQPSAAQLEELLDQLAACSTRGHDIQVKAGSGFVRRRGETLAFEA
ncbi:tRNA lysidine(34) synthetase TilS [Ramlibacter solisilvae]|uniref:tRNA(Ile)-lysidine synthase n=1 Tax=Ramlibacter tataouinensis TaxID=94132 RepID=A0A127JPG4_9BURK|nr:tRNA lysidine(34) synthetase TilS [Ramlibacter tataouinensis]AMO21829.1 tRNA(Ile)-lysidine synthetase [Ramlibacter tataouinensis]